MLIDTIEPDREFVQRVSVHVNATPKDAMRALREVTLRDMPVASFFGDLRYLPARLAGRMKKNRTTPFLDQLLEGGNVLLADRGEDIVLGGIGKYHQIVDQEPLQIPDAMFYDQFDGATYEKLAMEVCAIPDGGGGCELVLEAHTHPLGPAARKAFARYWKVIDPMGRFVSWLLLRAAKKRAERAHDRRPVTARRGSSSPIPS